jgi:hypothetical protein
MTSGTCAALSVVVVTPDCFETIRKTTQHLRSQTARAQIELVIVAPSLAALQAPAGALNGFHDVTVVELDPVESVAQGNTAGIWRATAPIIAFIEEHAYPDPTWAEALLRAHRGPWAAVGPVARNAAPDSVIAWADHLVSYGPWMDPSPAGPRDSLCWHNCSYKRDLLLRYGDQLEMMMVAETTLHLDLRSRGHQLYLEPEARIAHLGFTDLRNCLREVLHNGRVFAATRARNWSCPRRLLYTGGAPLIPAVRLWRLARQLWRNPRQRQGVPLAVTPAIVLMLLASALAEMLGYGLGIGHCQRDVVQYEFHRQRTASAEKSRP